MPTYRYRYFIYRGLGEVPRLLFALAGQEYEDVRFTEEQWPAEKPNTPFGQMPVLEVDDKTYTESSAIARYLAREFGYYGKNNDESTRIDQVMGITQDVITIMLKTFFEKDEAKKAELVKENKEVKMPLYLGMFEKILKDNGGTGYSVGNSVTLADLYIYHFGQAMGAADYDKFPLVNKCIKLVDEIPKIQEWVKKRPVTDH